ncbi:transcription repressor OFP1-like [Impatiens glandulifera]|uniref:transcription repressor OFP1-like n=1 Tax=Impatiens glandulifera TaxID=253017 RepID=UPI001FB0CE4C|nr:transcription repressor OFP1-like [Impatiens glandulifera]
MGENKFKLSNMIPSAWFYKLKDMGKRKNQNLNHSKPKKQHSHISSSNSSSLITSNSFASSSSGASSKTISSSLSSSSPSTRRKSQYFKRDLPTLPNSSDTHFPDSPKISSKHRPRTRKNRASSPRRSNNSPSTVNAKPPAPDSTHSVAPTHNSDVCITFDDQLLMRKDSNFSKVLNLELPSIVTKRDPKIKGSLEKERGIGDRTGTVRRRLSVVSSPGMKLRTNSPKIMNRRKGRRSLKKLSETYAVMKSPDNPRRDFMESMMEMIVENDIKRSKDLEGLLACYLQLNSNEYHEVIVDVFKEIWFDLADIRMKKKKK